MGILADISDCVKAGEDGRVEELARSALAQGVDARRILDEGLVPAMAAVGELFKSHEIFLPDVLLAAKAMIAGLEVLRPVLAGEGAPSRGKVVIGTVRGDLHDIGKNLVGIMLKGAGFEVIDLGHDVPAERFVAIATAEQARVIGMSALLTTTMTSMGKVVELLRRRGLSGRIRTIVGGAPVSAEFAREIGADAHGYDAANAVERVAELMASAK